MLQIISHKHENLFSFPTSRKIKINDFNAKLLQPSLPTRELFRDEPCSFQKKGALFLSKIINIHSFK